MADYKQDLKVSYGDFSFPVPSPYVTRNYEHEYLGGELWATKVNVSLNGQIALLPKRESAGGNNYEKLRAKRDQIAKEFAGGLGKSFQDFKVIGHGTSFILKNCSVTGVSFDSSRYVGIVNYNISLSGYLDEETSSNNFYETNHGVSNPVDSWSYSESAGIGSLTHTISATGYNSDKSSSYNAFIKAKSFVDSRKGLTNQISSFFISNVHPKAESSDSLILTSISETVDRLSGSYSITENYSFATNKSSVAAGKEVGLPNPQTKNVLTTYTLAFDEDHESEFVEVTISGEVSGSKDSSVSWEDVRSDFKSIKFYELANKAYLNHIERTGVNLKLNESPVTFSISPNEEAKKIGFSLVYDNNSLYSLAKFKNGGAYFDYEISLAHDNITDIVQVNCSGTINTRSSLKKKNRQAKVLLDELLDNDLAKIRQEATSVYEAMFPERKNYSLTNFAEGISVTENKYNGTISIAANFSDADHFEKDTYIKNPNYSISIDPPNQEYRTAASCVTNGDYLVYDLKLKTKRETVGISCSANSSSSIEDNFETAASSLEDYSDFLLNSFLTGDVKRLDSETKVADLIPNDITFNRGLSHEKDTITLRMDRK